MKNSVMLLLTALLMSCGQTGPLQLPSAMTQASEDVTEASSKLNQKNNQSQSF